MIHKSIHTRRIILGASILLCTLFAAPATHAQESVEVLIRENGTERQESIELPKSMTYPLDSLLNDWKAKNYIDLGKDCSTSTVNPMFSDSVYIDRLSRMPTVMEMPYNEIVRKFIDMYAGRLRNQVAFMLSACNFYMPIFEEALDAYGLPLELKYLPVIESALNPSAVSRAGACGLWQFMLATGKIYGLESNSLVDERRDPIKATWAAAHYLKDMYDIYKDWNLVIAAYNCGPGTINKAIRRSGGKTDYWEIYNYLPKETRGYVPAFIAANYVMTYYCKHNICPHGNRHSGGNRYGADKPQPSFRADCRYMRHQPGPNKEPEPPVQEKHHPRREQAADTTPPHQPHQCLYRQTRYHLCPPQQRVVQEPQSSSRFRYTLDGTQQQRQYRYGECHLPQDTQWREPWQHRTEIRRHCQSAKKLEWIAQYQNLRRKALEDL